MNAEVMAGDIVHKPDRRGMILASVFCGVSVLILFFVFPYAAGYFQDKKTMYFCARNLWRSPDWQHGMFVPFITAVLIWWKRKELVGTEVRPSWWGIAAIVFSLFLYWVGYKANVYYFGFAGMHGIIGGLVLWILGWGWFRKLFFFLCFLGFMWPATFLENQMAVPLRYVMVSLSSGFLNILGIDNLRVGTAIVSSADPSVGLAQGEKFQLDVANPCSGIRSLFALMMVSALYGYIALEGVWKRVALFAASIPLAVLGNFVRILLLLFGTLTLGSDVAIGDEGDETAYHLGAGFAVFGVALAGMVVVATLLRYGFRFKRSKVVRRDYGGNKAVEGGAP